MLSNVLPVQCTPTMNDTTVSTPLRNSSDLHGQQSSISHPSPPRVHRICPPSPSLRSCSCCVARVLLLFGCGRRHCSDPSVPPAKALWTCSGAVPDEASSRGRRLRFRTELLGEGCRIPDPLPMLTACACLCHRLLSPRAPHARGFVPPPIVALQQSPQRARLHQYTMTSCTMTSCTMPSCNM